MKAETTEKESQTGGFCVLPFEEKHIPEAARIEKLCFSDPWSPRALEYLCRRDTVFAVACEDRESGRLAAYGGMEYAAGEGHIINVATHPSFRRLGCARSVLFSLIRFCREHGISTVDLEVRESNAPAISLYRGAGFLPVAVRKRFYRFPTEDAIIMSLSIGSNEK